MILPLERQVVSLTSAKKLKELGFPQNSLFYWNFWQRNDDKKPERVPRVSKDEYGQRCYFGDINGFNEETICSAYTCAELGEMLPDHIGRVLTSYLCIERIGLFEVGYCQDKKLITKSFEHKNLCEALGLLLIHLAETGLIKVKEM